MTEAWLIGAKIDTSWSGGCVIREVACSVSMPGELLFHGVRATDTTPGLEELASPKNHLLWVQEMPGGELIWRPDFYHLPLYTHLQQRPKPKNIATHYEMDGLVYYAVAWEHIPYPTWQSEEDLVTFQDALSGYYHKRRFLE